MHVDTGHNFPETIQFRDDTLKELGVNLIVGSVQESIDQGRVAEEKGMELLEKPKVVSQIEGDVHVYGNPHIMCSPIKARQAAENIAMDKVYRLLGRPIAMGYQGCNFTYGDTKTPVPIHTYASLAKQVVDRWYKSPGHKKNLLNPKFRRLGSGVGIDPNGPACGDFYLTQNFAD